MFVKDEITAYEHFIELSISLYVPLLSVNFISAQPTKNTKHKTDVAIRKSRDTGNIWAHDTKRL